MVFWAGPCLARAWSCSRSYFLLPRERSCPSTRLRGGDLPCQVSKTTSAEDHPMAFLLQGAGEPPSPSPQLDWRQGMALHPPASTKPRLRHFSQHTAGWVGAVIPTSPPATRSPLLGHYSPVMEEGHMGTGTVDAGPCCWLCHLAPLWPQPGAQTQSTQQWGRDR